MADSSVAETQWNNFCSNVVADWTGSWTFWDPQTDKVSRSLKCIRSFILNDDKSIVVHRNIGLDRPLLPGHSGPWEMHKEDTDDQGLYHPALPKARTMLLSNGSGVLALPQIADSDRVVVEIFLCRGDHRCSVVVSYNESNELRSFGTIREKQRKAQIEMWSPSTELRESFLLSDFTEDFIGVERTFDDSNRQLSLLSDCKWDKDFWLGTKGTDESEDLLLKFLPDTICLACPKQRTKTFSVRACVLFTNEDDKELQELTLSYVDGHLHSIKEGLYH